MSELDKKDFTNTYKEVGPYLGLGTQLAASIILLFFLGKWLDEKFELFPLLTITFSFLGGFAGIYNFIKSVLRLNEKKKNEKHT
ncbi:MAG: AtpZ/AtpI family protein [Bacteroidetes bacterium]|nr:AtpZ/AtpI family protein [Bacteroidota bacterium]MBU1115974.1 AtpZ/AtpI family protein [Bacteroidota bacterium]MBU1798429.1 AtpZ/AtpI family protein [Bacteroidota bacterium]